MKSAEYYFNLILALFFLSSIQLSAQQTATVPNWKSFQFLLGDWVGEGGGDPGQGSGYFSFSADLQKTIIVRKNHSDFPATKDRPAFSHDDLTIIYQKNDTYQAVYFDNERHVINYTVTFPPDSKSVLFISEPSDRAPRFRLTYTQTGENKVKIAFDIAPPGKPDAFAPYIESVARRK